MLCYSLIARLVSEMHNSYWFLNEVLFAIFEIMADDTPAC